ncbi:MAG: AfsA-related hotdog domain-containing protein [Oleiphilaceae bacterium]|nr:AfsA-related hotdog domain-containing protein [Oleiphilaceae bacterium]
MKTVYIVGDRFKNFLKNEHTVSISAFEKMLFRNKFKGGTQHFALGQGVSTERANNIVRQAPKLKALGINIAFKELNKSGQMLVHKHNYANSLLSAPRKLSANRYQADVYIDDRCDELCDHITGQHVSGMLIVEACRQMFLAVTEQFYLKPFEKDFYFVIRSLHTQYHKFVFPLDIVIDYTVRDFQSLKPGVLRFDVEMQVRQCDETCATVRYQFSTYEAQLIAEKEAHAAQQAIQYATASEALSYEI